jgi:hypothetical protein
VPAAERPMTYRRDDLALACLSAQGTPLGAKVLKAD